MLLQLAQLWREDRSRLEREATRAVDALQQLAMSNGAELGEQKELPLQHAYEQWSSSFDGTWGGFGGAPKFPRPSVLFFLLRYARFQKNSEGANAQEMALFTLRKMAAGGLQDHLGGGFHRYSVDRIWQVPHFEKMLYDQAQLAMAYLEAWQITGEEEHAVVVRSILDYVLRDMTSPEGGFYSAEDADSIDNDTSQKREGAFYVWSEQEIQELLTSEEATVISAYYHVSKEGNIASESDPHGELIGKSVLMIFESMEELSRRLDLDQKEVEQKIASAKEKLFAAQQKRPRPHRDDKILTAWNGLMISAYARAASQKLKLQDEVEVRHQDYLDTAIAAALFIRKNLYDEKLGKLHRSWREGHSTEQGFAEDYAFLIQGLLDLYEGTFDIAWLQWAEALQKKMDELFGDASQGGYFSSAAGDPHLLLRTKEEYDGAEPSANSVAALNLLRFSRMLDDTEAAQKASRIFNLAAATLERMPTAVPQLLVALWYSLTPPRQSVIAGTLTSADTQALIATTKKGFHPEQVTLLADGAAGQEWLSLWNATLRGMQPLEGQATLYRCEDFCCEAPVTL